MRCLLCLTLLFACSETPSDADGSRPRTPGDADREAAPDAAVDAEAVQDAARDSVVDATDPVDHALDGQVPIEDAAADQALEDAAADLALPDAEADAEADAAPDVEPDAGGDPSLPRLHLHGAGTPEAQTAMVREVIAWLGMTPDQGPRPEDRFFVGRHYIAWVDETGFVGKLNGLWRVKEGALVSTVNQLVPGERGAGRWPAGYPGGEHVEFPNRVPEPNDRPDCANGDWCNQYAHIEAPHITDPDIPWWSACNRAKPSWDARFEAIEVNEEGGALEIWYEAPLVKVADGDGDWDGDACGEDYLFDDGQRRRVMLRTGYVLHADQPHLDRLMRIHNPAGNPPFDGPMSLIGGFVITTWPEPHPQKQINRYLRLGDREIQDPVDQRPLRTGWSRHDHPPAPGDEIFAWLDQPIALSARPWGQVGQALQLSHEGPSDNRDVGVCFCRVHGGLEMGGGLIHGGISLPVAPGEDSVLARRRLALLDEPAPEPRTYEAEDLSHGIGRADADGWSANTAADEGGHLIFGPYAQDWGEGSVSAEFVFMVDDNAADDLTVLTIEIYDADADEILVNREVRRRELAAPAQYQGFEISADLGGRGGHRMELRAFWHDVSYVRIDRVDVRLGE